MIELMLGDCLDVLPTLEDESVHAVVTDPPYEISFAGKKWDGTGIAYNHDMWREILRVLKPGGHLLTFGGARTFHRVACAVEDSGFEIRDTIMWLTGQGFPKSYNISKGIDKTLGAKRPVVGFSKEDGMNRWNDYRHGQYTDYSTGTPITEAGSEEAAAWEGWGTTLKPAHEPIILARKPFKGGVAKNVLENGAGGINVDATRIEGEPVPINKLESWSGFGQEQRPDYTPTVNDKGRWPANVISDEGLLGEAAKFFYCPKATKAEKALYNDHETVKPLDLMRYLVRMVTPRGGIVLDPFVGSGTTALAARAEGVNFIGIEQDAHYLDIANRRLSESVS